MEIVHLWDQASYAENLSSYGNGFKLNHQRFSKLPDFGWGNTLVKASGKSIPFLYGKSLDAFVKYKTKKNCIFEFHSISLLQRFPNLYGRSILHVHGSEIRSFGSLGEALDVTSSSDRYTLANVPLVLYSTPDLAGIVLKYTDKAAWAPHLTNLNQINKQIHDRQKLFDVVFPSALSSSKSADEILNLIRTLLNIRPEIRVAVLNSGSLLGQFSNLPVYKIAISPRLKFQKQLMKCDVALGQGHGLIGSVDVESIQLGLRYFPIKLNDDVALAYHLEAADYPNPGSILEELIAHTTNSSKRFVKFENAIKFHHSLDEVLLKRRKAMHRFLH